MNQEFLEELNNLDWNKLGIKLKAVAVFWVEQTFKDAKAILPKGYTLDDVVQEALQRSFRRKWNDQFDKSSYIKYLFGAIRSVVSNLAKSSDNKTTDRSILTQKEDDEEGLSLSLDDVATVIEDFDFKLDYESTMVELGERINGNRDLEDVLTGIKLGMEPREIAEELDKDVKEIYKLKRQLFATVEKIAKNAKS